MAGVLVAAFVSAAAPSTARAHKPSDAYLTLRPGAGEGSGRWDLAVRDLDHALILDEDGDGAVTWGELRRRMDEITGYALARLSLQTERGPCVSRAGSPSMVDHSDGAYLVLPLALGCPSHPKELRVAYGIFADLDPSHRGIVRIEAGHAGTDRTLILRPGATEVVSLALSPVGLGVFGFVGQGMRHIWEGLDHILFLLALLLPAVLWREGGVWRPVPSLRSALFDVVKVVTAFTAAHSLTLTLAGLGVASLPPRVVEPAIAVSVLIAALNNLWPVFRANRWTVAFALGLLHGFGFSTALAESGVAGAGLLAPLLGFNLGVELGQLVVVAAFVPLAFLLRATAVYRRWVLIGGSLAITGFSAVWLIERLLDRSLFG
jgi:hypothetical protein